MAVDLSFHTSPLSEEIRDEGRAAGRAEDILLAPQQRDIPVSDEAREHITTCADLDVLREWFLRSLTASTAEDGFSTE